MSQTVLLIYFFINTFIAGRVDAESYENCCWWRRILGILLFVAFGSLIHLLDLIIYAAGVFWTWFKAVTQYKWYWNYYFAKNKIKLSPEQLRGLLKIVELFEETKDKQYQSLGRRHMVHLGKKILDREKIIWRKNS